MRQTRSDSPSLIKHRPLDCSCVGIDAEEIPHEYRFDEELETDMSVMTLKDLNLHHPELTFGITKGSKRPKGYDYTARIPGGWRTANWRHTAELS